MRIDFSKAYQEEEFFEIFEKCILCKSHYNHVNSSSSDDDWGGVTHYSFYCKKCSFAIEYSGDREGHIVAGWHFSNYRISLDYRGIGLYRGSFGNFKIKNLSEDTLIDLKEANIVAEKYRLLA